MDQFRFAGVFARVACGSHRLEEVLALMPQAGFTDTKVRETTLPYMRSPASRHSRLETMVTWVTNKTGAPALSPRARQLPEWLQQADRRYPALASSKCRRSPVASTHSCSP